MYLKKNSLSKLIVLVLLPLVIGFIIEKLLTSGTIEDNQLYLSLGSIMLSIWIYGSGIVYWFYVGRVFSRLNISSIRSFILGNIVWGISISLYFWQSSLLDNASKSSFITGLSEAYPMAFMNLGLFISSIFANNSGNSIILISYVLMFIIFSLGFISTLCRKSLNTN